MLLSTLKIIHLSSIILVPVLLFLGVKKLLNNKGPNGIFHCAFLIVLYSINYSALRYFEKPIQLQKSNIIGTYKIDTDFYPGTNANWQHNNYSFEITNNKFILQHSNGTKLDYELRWSSGPSLQWEIKNPDHQIIENQVTLYRSHFNFYYVFKSSKWGNMFFRKVK